MNYPKKGREVNSFQAGIITNLYQQFKNEVESRNEFRLMIATGLVTIEENRELREFQNN